MQKKFDLVSSDMRYVGEAKRFKMLRNPSAKRSTIAEYVWLLQKVQADKVFMVFGQDAGVPEGFLKRYRRVVEPIEFYFLDDTGHRLL